MFSWFNPFNYAGGRPEGPVLYSSLKFPNFAWERLTTRHSIWINDPTDSAPILRPGSQSRPRSLDPPCYAIHLKNSKLGHLGNQPNLLVSFFSMQNKTSPQFLLFLLVVVHFWMQYLCQIFEVAKVDSPCFHKIISARLILEVYTLEAGNGLDPGWVPKMKFYQLDPPKLEFVYMMGLEYPQTTLFEVNDAMFPQLSILILN